MLNLLYAGFGKCIQSRLVRIVQTVALNAWYISFRVDAKKRRLWERWMAAEANSAWATSQARCAKPSVVDTEKSGREVRWASFPGGDLPGYYFRCVAWPSFADTKK